MKMLLKYKYIYMLLGAILLFSCEEGVDSDNRAPVIGDFVFSVLESISDDEVIKNLVASDLNLLNDKVTETLVFSLIENSGNLFELAPNGDLSLSSGSVLSFDNPFHQLLVKVTDSAGNSDMGTVTINVTKNVPPIVNGALFAKGGNIADDVVIGVITGIDPNTGPNITFSIKVNSNDLFEITPEGELSLADGKMFNLQTASEHTITVAASDGVLEGTAEVKILVLDSGDFVLRLQIANANQLITLNTQTTGDFKVDWGDGTITSETTNPVHTYVNSGSYLIRINGNTMPQFRLGATTVDLLPKHLVAFVQWGDNKWTNVNQLFMNCINMEYEAIDIPDFSLLVDMPNLFRGCSSMRGNATMGNWDTSTIKTMVRTFNGATLFNQDLSRWNVSNVTNYNFFNAVSGLSTENLPTFP